MPSLLFKPACRRLRDALGGVALMVGLGVVQPAVGANAVPAVTNLSVAVDQSRHRVVVLYDLADAEGDLCEVTINLSADDGVTYPLSTTGISGDVGPGVVSGPRRQIVWDYDPATIDFSSASTARYRIRLVADDGVPLDIRQLVGAVSADRLQQDLTAIAGIRSASTNPTHLEFTRELIRQRFAGHGAIVREQPFAAGRNLIGRRPGFGDERTTYVLDAHYDTVVDSPGADDNGSGVVGMLEAMRILAAFPSRRTLEFIAFDREEYGLFGSAAYVQQGIPSYVQIAGVFNFEMIGYYTTTPNTQTMPAGFDVLFPDFHAALVSQEFRGNFVTGVTNEQSDPLRLRFEANAAAFVPELRALSLVIPPTLEEEPEMRRSDHASFWSADIPAIMITDGGNYRNPHYHQASDTVASLNFEFMGNVVRAAVATLAELAQVRHAGMAEAALVDAATIPPPAPAQVDRTSLGASGFTAHWSPVGGASGYVVAVATDASFTTFVPGFQNRDVGSATAVDVAGLTTGAYYVRVQAYNGSGMSASSVSGTFGIGGRVVNLSARGRTAANDEVLIAGFVVGGSGEKDLLIRAAGPSLVTLYSLAGVPDPRLALFDDADPPRLIPPGNDDWDHDDPRLGKAIADVNAFEFVAQSKDAAMIVSLAPGAYTAHVQSVTGEAGLTILELYEMDDVGELLNISARAYVGSGDEVLIPGTYVSVAPVRLLVRAVGETLGSVYGIPGVLADPLIEVHQVGGAANPIRSNDDWSAGADAAAIASAAAAVSAFPLPAGSRDAVVLADLPAGGYTFVISGKGANGIVLFEIYAVP